MNHGQVTMIPVMQGWFKIKKKSINVTHHINIMRDNNYTVTSIDSEK